MSGDDETISGSKIKPLNPSSGADVSRDDSQGVTGSDDMIDQARIDPIGGAGVGQNPAPKADTQGVVGSDVTIQQSKLDPLKGPMSAEPGSGGSGGTYKGDVGDTTGARTEDTNPGLDEETVDGARVQPLGSVREDVKP